MTADPTPATPSPTEFIRALFGHLDDGWVGVTQLHDHGMVTRWVTADEAPSLLDGLEPLDTWVQCATRVEELPSSRRGGIRECYQVPALWSDLDWAHDVHGQGKPLARDREHAAQVLMSFPVQPTFIVDSGHGLQGWWVLDEPLPADEYERVWRSRWAATWRRVGAEHGVHVDPVWNADRMLRLPGTMNRKAEPLPVRLAPWRGPTCSTHTLYERLDVPVSPASGQLATQAATSAPAPPSSPYSGPMRPGDHFDQVHTCGDVFALAGWERLERPGTGGSELWQRPGKTGRDASAQVHAGDGMAQVYSTTAWAEHPALAAPDLSRGRMLTPFGLYAALAHAGDHGAAARHLGQLGYGTPWADIEAQRATVEAWLRRQGARGLTAVPQGAAGAVPAPLGALQPVEGEPQPSSWHRIDLVALRHSPEQSRPHPTIAMIAGYEHGLFYPGKVHMVIGESESGKTWLTLYAARSALRDGSNVLYIDFETDEHDILYRLDLLGLTDLELARFHYIRPDEALFTLQYGAPQPTPSMAVLREEVGQPGHHALVVLDGINEALSMHGLSMNQATEVAQIFNNIMRPIAKGAGAAVVGIDHVAKGKDAGAEGHAIGSQHKRAACDIMLRLVKMRPFAPGSDGLAEVIISKDRPGQLRASCTDGKRERLAEFAMASTPSRDRLEAGLRRLDGPGHNPVVGFANPLNEPILAYVMAHPMCSGSEVRDNVVGKAERIVDALAHLVHLGALEVVPGARGSKLYRATSLGLVDDTPVQDDMGGHGRPVPVTYSGNGSAGTGGNPDGEQVNTRSDQGLPPR